MDDAWEPRSEFECSLCHLTLKFSLRDPLSVRDFFRIVIKLRLDWFKLTINQIVKLILSPLLIRMQRPIEYSIPYEQVFRLKFKVKLVLSSPNGSSFHSHITSFILLILNAQRMWATRVRPLIGESNLLWWSLLQQKVMVLIKQEKRECAMRKCLFSDIGSSMSIILWNRTLDVVFKIYKNELLSLSLFNLLWV